MTLNQPCQGDQHSTASELDAPRWMPSSSISRVKSIHPRRVDSSHAGMTATTPDTDQLCPWLLCHSGCCDVLCWPDKGSTAGGVPLFSNHVLTRSCLVVAATPPHAPPTCTHPPQAVHMLFEGSPERPWRPDEERVSRMVGSGLKARSIACLSIAPACSLCSLCSFARLYCAACGLHVCQRIRMRLHYLRHYTVLARGNGVSESMPTCAHLLLSPDTGLHRA
jgi:hypothetical protein